MDRRRFLVISLAGALAPTQGAVGAPPASRVPRVAVYTGRLVNDGLAEALNEHGWADGRNIVVDWQGAEGSEARIKEYLARHPTDVVVAGGPHRIRAAMQATTTIPIIALDLEADPVAERFVRALAKPGGNVTGIWMDIPEIAGKQIQFLREMLPSLHRLGVIWDDQIGQPQFAELQAASRAANITVLPAAVRHSTEIDGAVKRLVAERAQAVVALTAPVIFLGLQRIAELAIQSRLPSISLFSPYPQAGGLMAYGPDFPAMWRQLAGYVNRVLRGVRAGDIPVERPSKFSLIINRKTAKALGLAIPPSLLARADQVIE
jgi:putative tryptophan/tyrosine transport system substrate-binding protein